jgi:hypothetical protein
MNDFDVRLPSSLKADCARCAGLCCVVHPFAAVQGFGFDKPARAPCRHLTSEDQCSIHSELQLRGFPGCVAFDCYGAGQRVTQEVLQGVSWRVSRESAARVFVAYETFLVLHRLMATLVLAEARIALAVAESLRRKRMELDDLARTLAARSGAIELAALEREVFKLIREAYARATSSA